MRLNRLEFYLEYIVQPFALRGYVDSGDIRQVDSCCAS